MIKAKDRISVVLPIYLPSEDHRKMTEKCLYTAIANTNEDVEWVIIETGSTYFVEYADIYIYEKEKTTPNISINRAFDLATGDYVVFLANDVFVCEEWVEKMYKCFEEREDCGIASLGNNEHKDEKQDLIIEDIYFSVSMFKKEDAWLDVNYDDLFDDTDMVMRIYANGKKCYKNLNGIVHHKPHSTYGKPDLTLDKNVRQRQYFIDKWSKYKDHEIYKRIA